MKFLALLLVLPLLLACAKSGRSSSAASSSFDNTTQLASEAASSTPSSQVEHITSCQVKSVTDFVDRVLNSGLSRNTVEAILAAQSGARALNQTVSCPDGGSVNLTLSSAVSYRLGYPISTATLSGGQVKLEFTQCRISSCGTSEALTVSGTALSGTLSAAVSVDASSNLAFASQAQASLGGDLHISYRSLALSCALDLTGVSAASGNARLHPVGASGTANGQLAGTACGFSVNSSAQNLVINF